MAADLQSHIQYWKSFDLAALQRDLDVTANDIAARQDDSDQSRKKLVEQSREFKKITSEDVRKQVAPLLKSFQTEVDALSKRSKAAEAAFLNVYKRLIDVPDPVAVLEHSLVQQKVASKVSDYEIENQKLRETLAEYNSEFAEVKNQEVTIKQLKEKIREYEQRIEAEVQSRSATQEKELNRQYMEKEKQLHETQLSFAKKLGQAEQQMSVLQSALDATQSELFEVKSKYEESSTAKSDEVEILMADLERANERAALAEREVESLKERLEEVQQSLRENDSSKKDLNAAIDQLRHSNLELELTAKEKEVSQLVEEIQKLQSSAAKQHQEFGARISRLEEELARKDELVATLNLTLSKQSDYAEIKKELNILKSVEFSSSQRSVDEQDTEKSLETLLLEKNKSLQSENTRLKNSSSELTVEGVKVEPTDLQTSVSSPVSRVSENSSLCQTAVDNISAASPGMWSSPVTAPSMLYYNPELLRESLDTMEISNRVKEILSTHNIGQRVFAKQVLGLSQGTVSELLSKPKHWDKLTEKGRESYRKMFYWLRDIRNVEALKNLSPRKPPGPFPVTQQDSVNTEERIAQILKEAQSAMISKNTDNLAAFYNTVSGQHPPVINNNHTPTAAVKSVHTSVAANGHKSSGHVPATVTASSSSKVVSSTQCRIPQSSSISEMKTTTTPSQSIPLQPLTPGCSESSEAIVSRIYQEELTKLAQQAKLSGNTAEYQLYQTELERLITKKVPPGQTITSQTSYTIEPQNEPEDLSLSTTSCSKQPHDLKQEPVTASSTTPSRGESPLQQMQNITNQFLSSSQAHLLQQKPLKHVLPPISQDQFDKYTGLNTEDLVKKVKELLSQYSISQRLFGENVLGLSQGSVSDLLARPKPWSMLTQKGREPFIRMKIFCEDPEAVKRLMSNQYKSGGSSLSGGDRLSRDTPSIPAVDTPERCRSSEPTSNPVATDQWLPSMMPNALAASLMQAPSIIELIAASGELDTLFVTSRVKEMLQFHNIGQKLFGEAVLGLSQGSVSDMLSKPKPWHLLSLKGREPFVRMHLWLTDPMNVFRLKSYQAEVKAFRRRSGSCGTNADEDRSSPYYIKKARYSFTEEQKNLLRQAFQNDPYPTSAAIEKLANKMELSSKTVINWFHNHRMRSKQQTRDENGRRVSATTSGHMYIKQETTDSNSYDGSQFPSHNSYNSDSQKSSPCSATASPDSTNPTSPPTSSTAAAMSSESNRNLNSSSGSVQLSSSGRKRKSAHPQYVSAGAMLDKHSGNSDDAEEEEEEPEIDVTGDSDPAPPLRSEQTCVTADESVVPAVSESEGSRTKIARLEQRVAERDIRWDDDEAEQPTHRQECMQKLESRVREDPVSDEWAF